MSQTKRHSREVKFCTEDEVRPFEKAINTLENSLMAEVHKRNLLSADDSFSTVEQLMNNFSI